jgi:hypothetical protein
MSSARTSGGSAGAAAKALRHAVRRSFIHELIAAAAPIPASAHADRHGFPLSSVTYHARLLVSLGVVEVAETVPRRGGIESRYRLGGPNSRLALAMLPLVDQISPREQGTPPP